jgi:anthranilate synthase component 1
MPIIDKINTLTQDGSDMKIQPGIAEFKRLSKSYNLIPVWAEVLADLETPVSVFMKVNGNGRANYLLESVEQGGKLGRYSFIGISPRKILASTGTKVSIYDSAGMHERTVSAQDPLEVIEKEMKRYRQPQIKELPLFAGGAVGYISYDYVRFLERLPQLRKDRLGFPDIHFQMSFDLIAFDHLKRKMQIISNAHSHPGEPPEKTYARSCDTIAAIVEILRKPLQITQPASRPRTGEFLSEFSKPGYEAAVKKAKEYIRAGDIIQVVISQRWEKPLDVEPLSAYRALRSVNPSPYMFFLKFPDAQLVGSSPEILVRCEGENAILRPIAGTRKRGRDDNEDAKLENELKKDAKEIAEHIMLVDLGRNDLGRVCRYGTVKVTDLLFVERYSHVMHLVSNVVGKLMPGKNQFDLLRACFPAGTVSGAPKVSAMEIIEELEKSRRGPYAGAVGYFSFRGDMDFCITIRTMFIKDGKAYIQAGGGIVADSIPENEFYETLNKSMALRKAYELAASIDSV